MATPMILNLKKLNDVASDSNLVDPMMYIAASAVVYVSVWPLKLRADSFGQMLEPTLIHCDNQSCMRLSVNLVSHDSSDCSRHCLA
jgi:hypothetical protein